MDPAPAVMRHAMLLALALAACRDDDSKTRVGSGEAEVFQVTAEQRWVFGTHNAPTLGDWVLRSRSLRVGVVGLAARRGALAPGSVFQVLWRDRPDLEEVRSVEPLITVEGYPVTFVAERFETLLARGEPVLRVTGSVAAHDGVTLRVRREWYLEPGRNALHVRTRVQNIGRARVRRVAVGARLGWGGAAPFAPGHGTVTEARRARAPWVGHTDEGVAMAWTRPRGDLDLAFIQDTHATERSITAVEAMSPATDLDPGGSVADQSLLLVSAGDLTTTARAAALLRGEFVVETPVLVTGTTASEQPTIVVTDAWDAVALVATPTEPVSSLPLRPGEYTAYAIAPGHAPADPVRFRTYTAALPMTLEIPPGGHIRVEAHDAATDRDLPVRIVVRGVAPTPDPMLGPFHAASGAGVVAVTTNGHARIPVQPGRYTVTVSHGPEWTIATVPVRVTGTLRGDVAVRLSRAVQVDAWTACDLHVHAEASFDSRVTVQDRVASLVAEGITFATPSEHNAVGDYAVGVAALPRNVTTPFTWVPSVEVTTDRNAPPWGHFNVYPYVPDPTLPEGAIPPYVETTPREIFRAARRNNPGAIIQVNHPRMRPGIGYFDAVGLDPRTNRAASPEYDPGYDAIEVFNGHFLGNIESVEEVLRDWLALLDTGARYVATGSSDSHKIVFPWAGYPRTYVNAAPDAGADEVLRALRAGRAFVTSGPMLYLTAGDAGPGDTVALAGPTEVRFRVRVEAAPWIDVDAVEVYRRGTRVATLAVRRATTAVRLDTEVPLAVGPGDHVVAVARGDEAMERVLPYANAKPFAFTNPIFFGENERAGARGTTRPDR